MLAGTSARAHDYDHDHDDDPILHEILEERGNRDHGHHVHRMYENDYVH